MYTRYFFIFQIVCFQSKSMKALKKKQAAMEKSSVSELNPWPSYIEVRELQRVGAYMKFL